MLKRMYQYRVTKYNPRFRDSRGAYRQSDWTSVADIGQQFAGLELTTRSYVAMENAYVESVLAFFEEAGIARLTIDALENRSGCSHSELTLADGHLCSALEIADITRLNLRNRIWCRLVGPDAFVHFGYDYYCYVGVPTECPQAIHLAIQSGLFVEPFVSPYGAS